MKVPSLGITSTRLRESIVSCRCVLGVSNYGNPAYSSWRLNNVLKSPPRTQGYPLFALCILQVFPSMLTCGLHLLMRAGL